jgi:hypothetical protein
MSKEMQNGRPQKPVVTGPPKYNGLISGEIANHPRGPTDHTQRELRVSASRPRGGSVLHLVQRISQRRSEPAREHSQALRNGKQGRKRANLEAQLRAIVAELSAENL